MLVQVLLRKMF